MQHNAQRLVASASALGAGLLGFGVGGLWGDIFNNSILLIVIMAGALLYVYGMYVMQMKKTGPRTGTIAKVLWLSAWLCLVSLVLLFIYLSWEK